MSRKNQERYTKYAEVRKINARNYYWKKKGKHNYYYIQRDVDLLIKKLKQIRKIADRLKLKIELKESDSRGIL
ncbi:MAG: hypothetical protein AABY22_03435 [Nanoarchaeota archaeon]|mgnify:CR=1 FL=1